MRWIVPMALALFVAASPASAGEGCASSAEAKVQHIFDAADVDGSGSLSPSEYESAGLQSFGVSFAETDADGDGETTLDEYLDLYHRTHPAPDGSEA
jgi:hypothetical protein